MLLRNCILLLLCCFLSTIAEEDVIVKDGPVTPPRALARDSGSHIHTVHSEGKKRAAHNEEHPGNGVDENKIEETIQEVKSELDRAVHSLNETAHEQVKHSANNVIVAVIPDSCGRVDCNNRGTCIGSRTAYFCACDLGFSGRHCEETVCDSNRDCNGRGLCLGTTSTLTCLCNIGFTGQRCESAT